MIHLIGIDCATQDAKIGLAFGRVEGGRLILESADVCSRESGAAARIVERLNESARPVLIAIDAPLGWPAPMGVALAGHRAGELVDVESNMLFRRETDRFIKSTVGKMPLDVGADRIARTAHNALKLLADVGEKVGGEIPLAWNPGELPELAAIEVYPAATLHGCGIPSTGYKPPEATVERSRIVEALREYMTITHDQPLLGNADALDAAICLLAAHDFLEGRAVAPTAARLARKEGWIWCRAGS